MPSNQRGGQMYESSISDRTYVVWRLFLYNGINHLREAKSMAPYAESKGVPTPESAVTLSALPLILGGASLLLGVKPKLGALAIIGFLAGVSPVMHDF
jgi:putative oxidoreductase